MDFYGQSAMQHVLSKKTPQCLTLQPPNRIYKTNQCSQIFWNMVSDASYSSNPVAVMQFPQRWRSVTVRAAHCHKKNKKPNKTWITTEVERKEIKGSIKSLTLHSTLIPNPISMAAQVREDSFLWEGTKLTPSVLTGEGGLLLMSQHNWFPKHSLALIN